MMVMDFFFAAVSLIERAANNIVVAAIVLLLGFIAGRLLGKLVERLLEEAEINKALENAIRINLPVDEVVASLVMYSIYFFSIILAIDMLNISGLLFNAAAIVIAAVIILSVMLALKDFIPNVFGGVFLHQKANVKKGDVIRIGSLEGKVLSVDLVDTKIETKAGDLIFAPNSYLLKNLLVVKKAKKQ